jgi:hypothetical protein
MVLTRIEDLREEDVDEKIDIDVTCLRIITEGEDKQKGVITDKGSGRAKYLLNSSTGCDYLMPSESYEIHDIEVKQVGDEVNGDYDAFLLFRSETEVV